jgi:hypothetical protein
MGGRDPMQPARNASLLMIVLGVLMLIYSLCNGVSSLVTSNEQLLQQMQTLSKEPPPFSIGTMRVMTIIISSVVMVLAIFLLMTAGHVRRGGSTAITVALIGVIIIVALLGLLTLVALLAGLAVPVAFIFGCIFIIPTALFALLLFWLIQARRGTDQLRSMQSQYQQQYMMYQQAMQQYGQQTGYGYGYSYPPPPAPPATPDKTQEKPPDPPGSV